MQTHLCFHIFCLAEGISVSGHGGEKAVAKVCPRVAVPTTLLSFVIKHLEYPSSIY